MAMGSAKVMDPGRSSAQAADARSESTHASEARPLLPQRSRQKTRGLRLRVSQFIPGNRKAVHS
jgi:hypothetical protein